MDLRRQPFEPIYDSFGIDLLVEGIPGTPTETIKDSRHLHYKTIGETLGTRNEAHNIQSSYKIDSIACLVSRRENVPSCFCTSLFIFKVKEEHQ